MLKTMKLSVLVFSVGLVAACNGDDSGSSDGQLDGGTSGGMPGDGGLVALTPEARTIVLERLGTLPEVAPADPTNRYADDPAAAKLGQALFFDTRYSGNGEISCATCHDPAAGFQDSRANTSEGLGFTGRSAPSVINAAFGSVTSGETIWHFWDGRMDSQWSQVLGPPENPVEMASTRTKVAYLIYDEYQAEYEAIFGAMPVLRDDAGEALVAEDAMPGVASWDAMDAQMQEDINRVYANFGKAVAAYERLVVSRGSRFDRFYEELSGGADNSDALSNQEKLGLELFVGKANCVPCHGGPNFTDWEFHNIAVEQVGPNLPETDEGRAAGIDAVKNGLFNCAGPFSDHPDKASCEVNQLQGTETDLGAFKTPSLRSVSQTAPYMHTGMLETLEDVMDHYAVGGGQDSYVGEASEDLLPFSLTEQEREALVAFMKALDGEPLDPSLLQAPAAK